MKSNSEAKDCRPSMAALRSGVIHFQRRSNTSRFSIERVSAEIRCRLSPQIRIDARYCPYESGTLWNLARNCGWARGQTRQVNHIVGDVHYLALALPAKKTILTLHDCVLILRNAGLRRLVFWFLWYFLPIRRAGIVTAVSEFTKRELVCHAKCDPDKIRVVHNPLVTGFLPTEHTFNREEPRILQIGTGWNKNLRRVAEALKGINCRLEIVGQLDNGQREQLARNMLNFREHQHVDETELNALYRACDIVLFASIYEGFGLPIIEAQASGRPVITSNVCSMPEVAGGAASFVSPFNSSSIRDGVLRVIEDEAFRNELVGLGFQNIKRYSPESISKEYLDLYNLMASDA